MEIKIEVSDLKKEDSNLAKELAELLKGKTNVDVKAETNEIILKSEGKPIPRTYVCVLLRKFLHQHDLKDTFRIIGGKENALIVKGIKVEEEE